MLGAPLQDCSLSVAMVVLLTRLAVGHESGDPSGLWSGMQGQHEVRHSDLIRFVIALGFRLLRQKQRDTHQLVN